MTIPRIPVLAMSLAACIAGVAVADEPTPQILFDGTSTDAFRNYKKKGVNPKWQIIDGALTLTARGGGDLITKQQYENFVLELEFKISPAGNSGVMYRVTEDNPQPWNSGPEIQIQDNVEGHDPAKVRLVVSTLCR